MPLIRLDPSTAPAPPRPKVRVSEKMLAMATAFSPALPMESVRASAPNFFFMYVSVSAVLFPITGFASWKLTRPSSTRTRLHSGALPSRMTPSMPQNLISAPRKPPA